MVIESNFPHNFNSNSQQKFFVSIIIIIKIKIIIILTNVIIIIIGKVVQEYERAVIFRWTKTLISRYLNIIMMIITRITLKAILDDVCTQVMINMTTMMMIVKMQITNKARPIAPWRSTWTRHLLHHPVH